MTPVPVFWVALATAVLLVVGWGWYSSNLLLQNARSPLTLLPNTYGVGYESVIFASRDGTPLTGWFVPAATPSDVTVIVCHGWGANRSDVLPHTLFLRNRGGFNLLYFDFRAHGESGGATSSLLVLESRDLEAAIHFVKEKKAPQARRLGVYGMSMGGAVALSVAAHRTDVEAVAAESPYSSFNDVVARFAKLFYRVPRFPLVPLTLFFVRKRLGFDPEPFSPIYQIDKISPRPVFLIQGAQDLRMPRHEGERLFARAKEPKALWTVDSADHGEAWEHSGPEYEERLIDFFRRAFSVN